MSDGLAGRRVVNTRAAHQAPALDALLRVSGALPVPYPCIAIVPPRDCRALDRSLAALAQGGYDWLVLTSTNTVDALAERLLEIGQTLTLANIRVAAVGPATARAANDRLYLETVLLPESYVAESLALALPLVTDARILLPESAIARPTLADALVARGAHVDVVTAYETVCGQGGADVPALAAQGQIDAVAFTSSSTVTCFCTRFMAEGGRLEDLRGVAVACIGEKTAATAREQGLDVAVVPATSTLEGLVEAIQAYYQRQGTPATVRSRSK